MPHHHTSICHIIIPPVDLEEPVGHFLDKARELLAGRNEGGQYFQGMPVSMCKSLSTLHPPPSSLHPPPSSLHPTREPRNTRSFSQPHLSTLSVPILFRAHVHVCLCLCLCMCVHVGVWLYVCVRAERAGCVWARSERRGCMCARVVHA